MNRVIHKARWGASLTIATLVSTALCVAVPAAVYFDLLGRSSPAGFNVLWVCLLPLATALFVVRSYAVDVHEMRIQRLLWTSHVPMAGLRSATFEPNVMRRSLRLFGNGGMFSITGLYRNRTLGNYRAFVTNTKDTVVPRFATRTIVVSPADPEQFVSEISQTVPVTS